MSNVGMRLHIYVHECGFYTVTMYTVLVHLCTYLHIHTHVEDHQCLTLRLLNAYPGAHRLSIHNSISLQVIVSNVQCTIKGLLSRRRQREGM